MVGRSRELTSMVSRVLVVDDEPELLSEVVAYLKRRGEDVISAPCYADAKRLLDDASQDVGILITDARMPDGNGVDLIQAVIDSPGRRKRCILMTGHLEASGSELTAAGVRILYKPFSLTSLHQEVRLARETQAG